MKSFKQYSNRIDEKASGMDIAKALSKHGVKLGKKSIAYIDGQGDEYREGVMRATKDAKTMKILKPLLDAIAGMDSKSGKKMGEAVDELLEAMSAPEKAIQKRRDQHKKMTDKVLAMVSQPWSRISNLGNHSMSKEINAWLNKADKLEAQLEKIFKKQLDTIGKV